MRPSSRSESGHDDRPALAPGSVRPGRYGRPAGSIPRDFRNAPIGRQPEVEIQMIEGPTRCCELCGLPFGLVAKHLRDSNLDDPESGLEGYWCISAGQHTLRVHDGTARTLPVESVGNQEGSQ